MNCWTQIRIDLIYIHIYTYIYITHFGPNMNRSNLYIYIHTYCTMITSCHEDQLDSTTKRTIMENEQMAWGLALGKPAD